MHKSFVVVFLGLTNKGVPTVINKFRLILYNEKGEMLNPEVPKSIPRPMFIQSKYVDRKPVCINPKDDISLKTSQGLVQKGESPVGILVFLVDLTPEEMELGKQYVQFSDAFGNTYSAEVRSAGRNTNFPTLDSGSIDFIPSDKAQSHNSDGCHLGRR